MKLAVESGRTEGIFTWEGGPAPLAQKVQGIFSLAESAPWPARVLIFLALANIALQLKVTMLGGGGSPWPAFFYEYGLIWGVFFAALSLILGARSARILPSLDDRFWTAALVVTIALFSTFQAVWLSAAFSI